MKLKTFQTLLANGDDIPTLSETESRELRGEFWPVWEAALESGEYKQGATFLQRGNTFCCLGVALDILNPEGWGTSDSLTGAKSWGSEELVGVIDEDLWKALGLDVYQETLQDMNDIGGDSFKQIAAYIRENMSK